MQLNKHKHVQLSLRGISSGKYRESGKPKPDINSSAQNLIGIEVTGKLSIKAQYKHNCWFGFLNH